MFRGVWNLVGIVTIIVGLVPTIATWTVNGWTVIAGIGVAMLVADLWWEDALEAKAREEREVEWDRPVGHGHAHSLVAILDAREREGRS